MKGSPVLCACVNSEQAEKYARDPLTAFGRRVPRCEQRVIYVSDQLGRCKVGSQLITVVTMLNLVSSQPPKQLKLVWELLQREGSGGAGFKIFPLEPREVRYHQEPGMLSRRKRG